MKIAIFGLIWISLVFANVDFCRTTPAFIRPVGSENATIEVIVFYSSNCPACRNATSMLNQMANTVHRENIRVFVKPLYRQLGDIALIAAERQSRAWELMQAFSQNPHRITADNIDNFLIAADINIDQIFEDMRDSTVIFEILHNNLAEARACGMRWTPHILFNGIAYYGEITPRALMTHIDEILTREQRR